MSNNEIKAIKLPDLSTASDEEIDALAERIWQQFTASSK